MNRIPDTSQGPGPAQKPIVALPFLQERLCCIFCGKVLLAPDGKSFDGLCVSGSRGIILTTCREHSEIGNMVAGKISSDGPTILKRFKKKIKLPSNNGEAQ